MFSGTPKKRLEPVFRTPMSFSPRLVGNRPVPSPSRDELWKKQLGFEDDQAQGSGSDSDDEIQFKKDTGNKENISMVEYHTLERQLEERNKQRDELLFKVKTLSDKNKQYKQKLEREEVTKRQQMKILCKTQEIKIIEKESLIESLQGMVEEQEMKIQQLEEGAQGNNKMVANGEATYSSVHKLIEDIKRLTTEKAEFSQRLSSLQGEMENHKCGGGDSDVSVQEALTKLEQENKQLREDLSKYSNTQQSDAGPCHTDTEKHVEKLQKENAKLTSDITELQNSQKQMAALFEQSTQQHKNLENEIKRLKGKIENLQGDLSHKKKALEEGEAKHREEVSKLTEENRKVSRRMRELMVEVTRLQAQEPEVVTKIKVVEVQVESDKLKEELKICQEERRGLHTKFDDLQTKHKDLSATLEQEQICNEDLTNEVTSLTGKLTEMAQATVEKLQEAEEEKERAIAQAKKDAEDGVLTLKRKYEELRQSVAALKPKYSHLTESYQQIQKEFHKYQKCIPDLISMVKTETEKAIHHISDHNKDLVRRYHREMHLRKKYHNELVELKGNIRVFCRVRPKIKEDGAGLMSQMVVDYDKDDDGLIFVNNKGRQQTFEADKVFTPSSTQEEVFDEVQSLVTSCIDGFNVCIFAYGQTGSGKTYTMEGTALSPGINQRALIELFRSTKEKGRDWAFTITMSVMEIYNEVIRDLLSDDPACKMEVKMNPDGTGLYVPGLEVVEVRSVEDVNQVFAHGQRSRATAATNMNEHSSRSHALLCITVTGVCKTTNTRTIGKLNLVDLAGSERVSKSGADGARLKEAQNINKSLSCLGDVIHALRCRQSHVPYRNSKLTYLLQDSLGGDSKTLMIVQIAPVEKNLGESVCSLNFAQRVRSVELGQATKRVEATEEREGTPTKSMTPLRGGGTPGRTQSMVVTTPRSQMGTGTPASKCPTPGSGVKLTPLSKYQQRKI